MSSEKVSVGAAPRRSPLMTVGLALGFAVLAVFFFTHAWVVDDAYITLRTIDNLVHGFGLRWNVDERVQSFTHPLWLFAVALPYAFTREAFWTVLFVSLLCSAAALWVATRALRRGRAPWTAVLLLALLASSKAFVDFNSSGLENPLTHLLLALFFTRFLRLGQPEPPRGVPSNDILALFFLAALGFVNRQDSIIFFAPACALLLVQWRAKPREAARAALLGSSPAIAWVVFAFVYFGSIVPNTAYAKLLGPRLTRGERFEVGFTYLVDSLKLDPATLALCAFALVVALRARHGRALAAAGGGVLYVIYVLNGAAVGTHMSGRFLSGVAFVSALVLASLLTRPLTGWVAGAASALVMLLSSTSPLRVRTSYYARPGWAGPEERIIDTREYVLREGASAWGVWPGTPMPTHPAYLAGLAFRSAPERVHAGGLGAGWALLVGYSAFSAGPDKHIIDVLGLTDPLIARLPLTRSEGWRPGHFFRAMPAGYLASIERRENLLTDPNLHAYYEVVRSVTRDRVFSGQRLWRVLELNLGRYDGLLEAYASAQGSR
ncbi:MAG: hypothetical protein ACYC8T_08345 [Myxococcaceae bacterium]